MRRDWCLLGLLAPLLALGCAGGPDAGVAGPGDDTSEVRATTEPLPPEDGTPWGVHPIEGEAWDAWNDPDDGKGDSRLDLADEGYVEREFRLEGSADAFTRVGALGSDGRWEVTPSASESFATRLLVRRPAAAEDFNGHVIVEWLNVSSGRDLDIAFRSSHVELMARGYAWVGVSAQGAGVAHLIEVDPTRYGDLHHPGDRFAFDILTRAGRAVADPASPVLGDLVPEALIAQGASQSAAMLLTYVNALQPITGAFDGFNLSSGIGAAGNLDDGEMPKSPIVRTDSDVPVLSMETEGDLIVFGAHRTRQPDSDRFRLWEIAGGAHAGQYATSLSWPPEPWLGAGDPCVDPANAAPLFVIQRAMLVAMSRWIIDGEAPEEAPRLELADPAAADPLARDADGNARGGVRLPHMAAPVARHDGVPNQPAAGSGDKGALCFVFGRSVPFSADRLGQLYSSNEGYAEALHDAADQAVEDGFLLPRDAELIVDVAIDEAPQL